MGGHRRISRSEFVDLNRRLHQCGKFATEPRGSFRSIAIPAFAGKYNKVVSVGDKAPTSRAFPPSRTAKTPASACPTSRKTSSSSSSWRNHCPVVQAYEDRMIDFTNDYKDKGVKVVGVCRLQRSTSDKHSRRSRTYMKEHKSNYVYGYDESQAIGKAYGATNTPQFFVLDKERKIRYIGAMDDNQNEAKVTKTYLRDAVDALLEGRDARRRRDPARGLRHAVQEELIDHRRLLARRDRSRRAIGRRRLATAEPSGRWLGGDSAMRCRSHVLDRHRA